MSLVASSHNSVFKKSYLNDSVLPKISPWLLSDLILKSFKLKRKETQHNFLITNVPAGRGFHWGKKIAIRVEGDLTVMIKDRALFLVNYIRLESYLMCVATSEMSGECPDSLLESQIIAARSWLLAAVEKKHKNLGLNVCNDDCCQRYQGIRQLTSSAINASLNTRGKVLTYHNQICDTRYSKSCGGFSENNDNVWNTQPREYLKGIYDYLNKDLYDLHNEKEVTDWIKKPPPSYCNDQQFKNINIKFIMSHFACAEDINNLMNKKQLEELLNCSKVLKEICKKEIILLGPSKSTSSSILAPILRFISVLKRIPFLARSKS